MRNGKLWACLMVIIYLVAVKTSLGSSRITPHREGDSQFIASFVDNGTKYRLSSIRRSYDVARQICGRISSKLLQIDSGEKQDIIRKFLDQMKSEPEFKEGFKGVWTGLKLDYIVNNTGLWNNEDVWKAKTNYTNFTKGQPIWPKEYCIQLRNVTGWMWDSANCTYDKVFICQNPVPDMKAINNLTSSIITSYSKFFRKSKGESTTNDDLNILVNTMNDILEADTKDIKESDQQSLSETVFVVEEALKNYDFEEGNLTVSLPNIRMEAIEVTNANQSFNVGDIWKPKTKSSNARLDENLLKELFNKGNNYLQLTSVVYQRPEIFETLQDDSETKSSANPQLYPSHVLSNVLSVSVGGHMQVSHLSSPLRIVNFIPEYITNKSLSEVDSRFSNVPPSVIPNEGDYYYGDIKYTVKENCVFWDFKESSWSTEGCRTENEIQDGNSKEIICSCDHMTHFAVILDLQQDYFPEYLSHITVVGCSISIICILITLAINLYFSQLRTKLPQQILINICVALLLINLMFVIGVDKRDGNTECFAFTILLHYSVLLLWAWLLVEGTYLYRQLIYGRSHRSPLNTKRFFIISLPLSYIVPAIIVALTAGILERKEYQSAKYCWLNSTPMLSSILIPIAIVIFINTSVFIVAIYNITGRRKMKHKSSLKEISESLRRAMCMVFTLGIPWIFGYMMLLSSNHTYKQIFSFIFSILNSLQGALIFYLYCVRQKNIRNLVETKFINSTANRKSSLMRRLHKSLKKRQEQLAVNSSKLQTRDTKLESTTPSAVPNKITESQE